MSIWTRIWSTLRSYGLDYDDFPTMIKNVSLLLRLITVDIDKNSNPISIVFYITTAIAIVFYIYVFIFSLFWMIVYYYGPIGDWIAVCVILEISACTYTSVVKFFFMKYYAKDIKNTVEAFLECDGRVIPGTRFAINLRKNLRIVKQRATIIGGSLMTIGTIYMSVSFLRPGRHFSIDYYLLYGLLPMLESPNYEIAMFINTVGTGLCLYTMVCTAVYVLVIVGYIEAQIRALSEEFDNLWTDGQEFYKKTINKLRNKAHTSDTKKNIINKFIRVHLIDIIKFHIANINLLHKLDHDIRPTLALECGFIGASIITELLGGLEHTIYQVPYSMVQIFMDCLAGQRLIDACDIFEFAIYNCKWENFNVENQKKILLILTMSQKTLVLTAGGIVYLNFNCMMVILKSTYSIYTTLKSTMN